MIQPDIYRVFDEVENEEVSIIELGSKVQWNHKFKETVKITITKRKGKKWLGFRSEFWC